MDVFAPFMTGVAGGGTILVEREQLFYVPDVTLFSVAAQIKGQQMFYFEIVLSDSVRAMIRKKR